MSECCQTQNMSIVYHFSLSVDRWSQPHLFAGAHTTFERKCICITMCCILFFYWTSGINANIFFFFFSVLSECDTDRNDMNKKIPLWQFEIGANRFEWFLFSLFFCGSLAAAFSSMLIAVLFLFFVVLLLLYFNQHDKWHSSSFIYP